MAERNQRSPWLLLPLFLMAATVCFSVAAIPQWILAGQTRGENFITGFSLKDFSGYGHIDSKEGDVMVIDDCTRRLSSNVKYYKPGPIRIPSSAFSVGSRVGYVEDRNGQIKSLWLLPKK